MLLVERSFIFHVNLGLLVGHHLLHSHHMLLLLSEHVLLVVLGVVLIVAHLLRWVHLVDF